jgi:hypothetical protein
MIAFTVEMGAIWLSFFYSLPVFFSSYIPSFSNLIARKASFFSISRLDSPYGWRVNQINDEVSPFLTLQA